jgi:hypothetical protein
LGVGNDEDKGFGRDDTMCATKPPGEQRFEEK